MEIKILSLSMDQMDKILLVSLLKLTIGDRCLVKILFKSLQGEKKQHFKICYPLSTFYCPGFASMTFFRSRNTN